MTIKLELTEWEVIVLRAALAYYRKKPLPPKHETAVVDIDRKSRARDNPFGALNRRKEK